MKTIHNKIVLVMVLILQFQLAHARLSADDGSAYSYQGEKSFWSQLLDTTEQKIAEAKGIISKLLNPSKESSSEVSRGVASEGASPVTASEAQPTNTASQPVSATTTQETTAAPTTATAVVSPVSQSAAAATLSSTPEQNQMAQIIEKTAREVKSKEALQVASPGRVGKTKLPALKSGVPVFALTEKSSKKKGVKEISVKDIPRLDIGLEKSITKNDFIPTNEMVGLKKVSKAKSLDSVELYSEKSIRALKNTKWPIVDTAQKPKRGGFELGQLVSHEKIEAVPLQMIVTKPLEALKPYVEFSASELEMIAAVILYEKGELCHIASGILTDLAEKKEFAEEANFYLGVCAHQMGFHSEAVNRLLRVIDSESPEFAPDAIGSIVENLPREYDKNVSRALKNIKNKSLMLDKYNSSINFVLARAAHSENDYASAATYSAKVTEKSKLYVQAQFMYAIALYGSQKVKESEQALLSLRTWMNKNNASDKGIEAQIAINLARMRFTQKRYQAANEEYMRVPKDQPMWVQALIEQGWTQLSIDDPEGAIGNMYSLHSPYFKSVFMPESWVVRTIGYIDICQYGDAYRTLTRLEQSHKNWLSAVDTYTKNKKSPADYYSTVKNYIRGKSDSSVDGLPSQIIREIARQREFLNSQGALNVLEDEITQYQFIYGFIKRDQAAVVSKLQKTKVRLAQANADIASINKNPELIKNINEWQGRKRLEEQWVRSYEYQEKIYEKARQGYLRMKTQSLARIEGQKTKLREQAGRELMSHLKDVHARLDQILEGNEFLRYEIFSGSGENIRYQVTGGSTAEARRIPANVKPQKILNWEFDGEYWEDEIGSYRSSLKNNCPKSIHSKNSATTSSKTAQND